MKERRGERGLSLVEILVAMAVLLVVMTGVLGLVVQSAQMNKRQKMAADVQMNARACLSIVVQKLRSAGWDPMNAGINVVALDPIPSDNIDQIEVFADLDRDSATNSLGEQILIRHVGDVVEWRYSSNTSDPFELVAAHITNDADGDGTPEAMFTPDVTPNPRVITVTVTARSPFVDPVSGDFLRYTVSSDVVLRKTL